MKRFNIGTHVRLTSDFLRLTGQYTGSEPHSRWIVQSCDCSLCKTGNFVAVNKRSFNNPERQRHIATQNLEKCRKK